VYRKSLVQRVCLSRCCSAEEIVRYSLSGHRLLGRDKTEKRQTNPHRQTHRERETEGLFNFTRTEPNRRSRNAVRCTCATGLRRYARLPLSAGCRRTSYRLISAARARPRSAVNPPTAAAAVDRRDRQTDDWTEGHPTVT